MSELLFMKSNLDGFSIQPLCAGVFFAHRRYSLYCQFVIRSECNDDNVKQHGKKVHVFIFSAELVLSIRC